MLTCYIVDDEKDSVEVLSDYIKQTPFLDLVEYETDSRKVLEFFNRSITYPDIIFLDIEMPYISGLTLASLIDGRSNIIFSTAHSDFAVEAFNLDVVDYLKKPFSYKRFLQGVSKVREAILTNSNIESVRYIFLQVTEKKKTVKIKIDIDNILRIEGLGNYIKVFTIQGMIYVSYGKLSDLEYTLPNYFVRSHRSHILNFDHVERIENNSILLKDGFSAPIGEKFRKNLLSLKFLK